MPYRYRSMVKAREHLMRRGLVPRRVDPPEPDLPALGAADFTDLCLTEEALKGSSPKWCSCYRRFGDDVEGGHAGLETPFWRDAIAFAAAETAVNPASIRVVNGGTPPWGTTFEMFDFSGTAARRWLSKLLAAYGGFTCSSGQVVHTAAEMFENGGCCTVCPWFEGAPPAAAFEYSGCTRLDNGCAHSGATNTEVHFGGPVLEYFNFSRLLRLLAQWPTVEKLPASFAQNFNVDRHIAPAMKQAYENLNDFLGRSWPMLDKPFDAAAQQAAKKRLLAHKSSAAGALVEQIGPVPHHYETWFNRLRWLTQRIPGGDAWHCVWSTPLVTDVDSAFDPNNPWGTGLSAVLYRHTPSHTIVPGDWLVTILDMLAPGWTKQAPRPLATPVRRPPAAVTAAASVAAAAGVGALVWFFL